MTAVPKSTLDALPKAFVSAMRTLFDVMDDNRTGYVRLSDIEKRWATENETGGKLPIGVIESLRKVSPANGLLTFERFCAGLRICLLRQNKTRPASVPLPERGQTGLMLRKTGTPKPFPQSPERLQPPLRRQHNTATVRPINSGAFPQQPPPPVVSQRAISMPQLAQQKPHYPPLLPKRDAPSPAAWIGGKDIHPILSKSNMKEDVPKRPEPMDKSKVTLALEKWRLMKSYQVPKENQENMRHLANVPIKNSTSFPTLMPNEQVSSSDVDSGVSLRIQDRGPAAKKANRRREPRRHTVSTGIDYNMIKRLKLLEQEKDFLLQGLEVVERAKKWYLQQVSNVNDKLDRVSKWDIPHSEYSMDAQHERLNFQMTRISEVNQHLNALMETSEKGFPIHMNLAVHQRNIYNTQKTTSQTIQRLKDQNHALTEEIAKKSETITQLETEKSALIRELFHARAYSKKDSNDTTLW